MDFTKIDQADLDSPCQEFSNGGPGIVIAFTFFLRIDFLSAHTYLLDAQSSCRQTNPRLTNPSVKLYLLQFYVRKWRLGVDADIIYASCFYLVVTLIYLEKQLSF